jgi:hypothetical protein
MLVSALALTTPQAASGAQIKDVNVANTPNVNISNKVDNPIPVADAQNAAFQPFVAMHHMSVPNGAPVQEDTYPPAPENKRLVIEHVTVDARVPSSQRIVVYITGGDTEIFHALVLTSQGTFGTSDRYVASQPIRLYVEGGGIGGGWLRIERSSDSGLVSADFTISGHLVDLP